MAYICYNKPLNYRLKTKVMKVILRSLALSLTIVFLSTAKADAVNADKQQADFVAELEHFVHIYGTIKQGYVDDINHKELFRKAIKGMVGQLDPHSSYLEPKEQKNLMESSSGRFGGLGIVIGMEDGLVKIISPIDDTPAYRAGLQSSDLIIKIDSTSVRGLSLSDAVDLMRGKPKTKVKITILRKGSEPFEVEIIRDIITIVSVKGYLLEDGIAYVRVSSFQSPSVALFKKILTKLIEKNKNTPLKGLVLDLRNNPGGLLSSAIEISDLFLDDKGVAVSTKGRADDSNIEYNTQAGDILDGVPIAVLINRGSASASEIVAGALQDYKRAIILGEKSFGKGSVQTVTTLNGGFGLKLTTARYYTPSGRSIQGEGITPDIKLEQRVIEKSKPKLNIRESEGELKGHITQDSDKEKSTEKQEELIEQESREDESSTKSKEVLTTEEVQAQQKEKRDKEEVKKLKQDYFVDQAINALKVMTFWR